MTIPAGARLRDVTDLSDRELDWYHRVGQEPCARLHVDVTLRRVSDGVERVCVDDSGFSVTDGDIERAIEAVEYQWTDGNYGCDCNRALFFARAGGDDPDLDALECSHGKFVIVAPEWLR